MSAAPQPSPRVPGLGRVSAVGLGLLLALYAAHALSFWRYVNDDAYITFRYSANLAQGRGPYYNAGERVEGYTNPLLMLLVAGAIRVGGTGVAAPFAKGLGVLCGALCVVLAWALARTLWPAERTAGGEAAGLVAAGLVAVAPGFALNSVSGLETTLFAACLGAGVLLGLRPRPGPTWLAGLAFGLAALARPEGTVVFAVFWLARFALAATDVRREGAGGRRLWQLARERGLASEALVVTLVVAAQIAVRWWAYDGELLPNTYYAKIGGFAAVGAWTYVRDGTLAPFLGLTGLVLAAGGLALGRVAAGPALALLTVSLFGGVEPLWAASDWMLGYRLVAPYLPLLAAWVAVGWSLLASAPRRLSRVGPLLVLATLPWQWARVAPDRQALWNETALRAQGYATGHRALGAWLASGGAGPGDTVALMDIGIVGYAALQQQVLDLTGLTDRVIGKSPGGFLRKTYDPRYVLARHPALVVLVLAARGRPDEPPAVGTTFVPWTPGEEALLRLPEFQSWYVRPRPAAPGAGWVDALAAQFGAERIFEHRHPGIYYLLVVFRRQAGPAVAPSVPPAG